MAQAGARSCALTCDIAETRGHDKLLDEAEAALGPIDCLVNNAGVSVLSRGDLLDVTPEANDHCQHVNTRGTFFLTQAFARRLLARPTPPHHRRVVTITSTNAQAVSIQRGEYCVSKAALSMVSSLFAVRLGGAGIGVYEVMPGLIETEMSMVSRARYEAEIERGWLVMPRWGRPKEVGRAVATLAQGLLPYTVGQAVRVDGGMLIHRYGKRSDRATSATSGRGLTQIIFGVARAAIVFARCSSTAPSPSRRSSRTAASSGATRRWKAR